MTQDNCPWLIFFKCAPSLSIYVVCVLNIIQFIYFIWMSTTFIFLLSRKKQCQPPGWDDFVLNSHTCAHYTYMSTLHQQTTKFVANQLVPKQTNKWTVILTDCHPPPPLELSSPLNRWWNRTKHYGPFLTDLHFWGFPCPLEYDFGHIWEAGFKPPCICFFPPVPCDSFVSMWVSMSIHYDSFTVPQQNSQHRHAFYFYFYL